MSTGLAAFIWFVGGLFFANWPFLVERRFGVLSPGGEGGLKSFRFRLLELAVGYGLTIGLGFLLESSLGAMQSQTWNFYAISALLFLVMAYPGFVWRYLRRGRPRP